MKIKRILCAVAALAIVAAFAGCGAGYKSELSQISKTLSVDCSGTEIKSHYDSHGGFLGDGTSFYALQFSDDSAAEKIKSSSDWKPFPLPDSLKTVVWGLQDDEHDYAPMIIKDNDWNHPLIPQVENGYYFFFDRHSDATNPKDDSAFLDESRPSYNFTVAIYDSDTNMLYYARVDT